jgi:2-polyprenyl-3-methyl-5-hydroxy-6-metoxy-1,4-benzoquinol methylase
MDYDPVKNRFGDAVAGRPWLTRAFFAVLQILFLRAWYVRREIRRQLAVLGQRPNLRVLDAGTGFGQFSWYLVRKYPGLSIEAVDVKEQYLDRARVFFARMGMSDRVAFSRDDLTKLQAEGPFDLILCVDVMEHIEDDEQVFRNFKRVLAPGGVIIVNTPSDRGGSDVHKDGAEGFIGEHVRTGYGKEEIAWKLSLAGLEATRSLYTYGAAGGIAWRLLVKIPMLMLGISRWLLPLLPIYYIPALPIGLVLNMLDVATPNRTGTGLLVVAEHR